MNAERAHNQEIWTVADQLAAALERGVDLDFANNPERPVLALAPGTRAMVAPLLEDDATRLRVQAVLRWAVRYRRALQLGDRDEAARWLDTIGVRVAAAVRRAGESDSA